MPLNYILAHQFHPHVCAASGLPQQGAVVCPLTSKVIALFASNSVCDHCIVACYVYDAELWAPLFSKPLIAEAVLKTGLAFVTKVTYEPQWV